NRAGGFRNWARSKRPPKHALRRTAETSWRSVPQTGHTEGEQNRGTDLMPDHIHMMISIPPKCAVSQVVGYIKGKSAIYLARVYGERKRNWVPSSTSGLNSNLYCSCGGRAKSVGSEAQDRTCRVGERTMGASTTA